jgi:hypothetical protein
MKTAAYPRRRTTLGHFNHYDWVYIPTAIGLMWVLFWVVDQLGIYW